MHALILFFITVNFVYIFFILFNRVTFSLVVKRWVETSYYYRRSHVKSECNARIGANDLNIFILYFCSLFCDKWGWVQRWVGWTCFFFTQQLDPTWTHVLCVSVKVSSTDTLEEPVSLFCVGKRIVETNLNCE